jgi:hypothetical protein
MTAIVRALSPNAINHRDVETLNWLMIFSSAGLLVSMLCLLGGIDLGGGLY